MGGFFKIQNSNFCHLRMGEDNLMKLSGIIALVSLCVNLKGHGRGIKMRVAITFFTRIGDFPEKRAWQP